MANLETGEKFLPFFYLSTLRTRAYYFRYTFPRYNGDMKNRSVILISRFLTLCFIIVLIFLAKPDRAEASGCLALYASPDKKFTLLDQINFSPTDTPCVYNGGGVMMVTPSGSFQLNTTVMLGTAGGPAGLVPFTIPYTVSAISQNIGNISGAYIHLGFWGTPVPLPCFPWIGSCEYSGYLVEDNNFYYPAKVAQEDAVIDNIAISHSINAQIDGSDYTIPATNCVKLSGDGPRKVVFMRGESWNSSISEFLQLANDIINNGFKFIDPFQTYQNQFTFYVDLKKSDDQSVPTFIGNETRGLTWSDTETASLRAASSCNGVTDSDSMYLLYTGKPLFLGSGLGLSNFTNNIAAFADDNGREPYVTIHEMGHIFGKLFDEYLYSQSGSVWNLSVRWGVSAKNCTPHPSWDYRARNNKIYGSTVATGCGFMYSSEDFKGQPIRYYRPSLLGIMSGTYSLFNVIDCGYIVAAIQGQAPTQENASKHWPENDPSAPWNIGCMLMAKSGVVIKDGIPPLSPTPNLTTINE